MVLSGLTGEARGIMFKSQVNCELNKKKKIKQTNERTNERTNEQGKKERNEGVKIA